MKEHAKSIIVLMVTLIVVAVSSGCAALGRSKTSYGGAVGALDNAQRTRADLL
ncbi:MAG: hypothetical protein WCN95_14675 [bacterium]